MRYKTLWSFLFLAISGVASAHWEKVNDVDYTWGPFKIYNISLFTETGEYKKSSRPVMLTLKYSKPVDGRDFAISVAKSWADLGLKLQNQNDVIDRLRKTLPDLKPNDVLSYIALEDRGYFVLNNEVIAQEFDREFNDAMLAVWLDSKVGISRQLTTKKVEGTAQEVHYSDDYTPHKPEEKLTEKTKENGELKDIPASTEQAVDVTATNDTNIDNSKTDKPNVTAPEPVKPTIKVEENKTEESKTSEPTSPQAMPSEQPKTEEKPVADKPDEKNEDKNEDKKEENENPEKIIIPEMDPTPQTKQSLS